ncbi:hypothetical protein [Saccharococcus thermophilus]|uniref:Uncharacterized protein n=1 Tax=Saccharococcus thermophilus TaxID=29396 RepID=A0A846MEL9_9BACL|nr:hypothetical protein [Saccharococcus thermophilus]NIK15308.1 hypothetical protein [Saccharococcus thermophilus]
MKNFRIERIEFFSDEMKKEKGLDGDFGIVATFEQDGKKKYFAMQLGGENFEKSINELMEIARQECEWVSMNEIA